MLEPLHEKKRKESWTVLLVSLWTVKTGSQVQQLRNSNPSTQGVMVWVKVAGMCSVTSIEILLDLLRKSDSGSGADQGFLHHSDGSPDCKDPRANDGAQSSAV